MTLQQKILQQAYKVLMLKGRLFPSKKDVQKNVLQVLPNTSFYNLETLTISGEKINLSAYKGKKIIVVNTASNCGFTAQYDELENLYTQYKNKLIILAFPANDFMNQESGSNESIAQFCRHNFGISFPIMQKSSVIKGAKQNPVYNWLSAVAGNGWCSQEPGWNFCKYIINEQGSLTHYFSQNISPLSKTFIQALSF
ncbi:MAG: glutathione peroxidase [Deinococcales bacterium]|nr:glutathione peroxidase [Chitinophagaceae bacterium]